MIDATTRAQKTFRNDLVKGACGGILESGWMVFALLLAVRVFEASPSTKASLAAASSYGMLLTPISVFLVAMALAGIGLSTDLDAIRVTGMRPLALGAMLSVLTATVTLSMMGLLGHLG